MTPLHHTTALIPTGERPVTPGDFLRAELIRLADGHGKITIHSEKPWASITFAGTQHQVTLVFTGAEAIEAGGRLVSYLPEADLRIPGQLVADAAVADVGHDLIPDRMTVQVEVLMMSDNPAEAMADARAEREMGL